LGSSEKSGGGEEAGEGRWIGRRVVRKSKSSARDHWEGSRVITCLIGGREFRRKEWRR
jgi:hypothetical protein